MRLVSGHPRLPLLCEVGNGAGSGRGWLGDELARGSDDGALGVPVER